MPRLIENLNRVCETIAAACRRAGRDPAEVRLVAVTKYVTAAVIRELIAAGVVDLGENRVQQLAQRAELLGSDLRGPLGTATPPIVAAAARPRWHMIGHVQRNKARALLGHSRIVHSLDSVRLAEELERQAGALDVHVDALIELNVSGEANKSGMAVEQLDELLAALTGCGRIRLGGLMTMAPIVERAEDARPYFARLREILDGLRRSGRVGPECRHLSMGMSQDYGVAVEEGATIVRVGSCLYEGMNEA